MRSALLIALTASSVQAQSIDSIFSAYNGQTPGCAVAAVDNGRVVVSKGFGMASLEHDLPITSSSSFYAASSSKQFTAFAVALLAKQGKLSLDDDVRKWLPEVPNFGPTITVRHLIHHTSGLRDYFGLMRMTGWPLDGPITERQFLELVARQKSLNFAPGARYLYSNTGYVLLSLLVKRVSGQSLREYAHAQIFQPLGMNNSEFRDEHTRLIKNRAFGYAQRGGEWRLDLPGFDVVGDGGLYTTVDDLAKWTRNFANPVVGDSMLMRQLFERGRLSGGEPIDYGSGLINGQLAGESTIEHGGAYGGYRANVMYIPRLNFSVLMLCNAASANPTVLSQRAARALLGDRLRGTAAAAAPTTVPLISVPRERLSALAGPYWSAATEQLLSIELRDSALVAGGRALLPLAADRFRSAPGGPQYQLSWISADEMRMDLLPNGERVTYRRMPPARTDAAALATYAGSYYSPELDHSWRIEVKDGGLRLQGFALADAALTPVFLDAFQTPAGLIRFEPEGGRIRALIVGAGRVTGMRFERR